MISNSGSVNHVQIWMGKVVESSFTSFKVAQTVSSTFQDVDSVGSLLPHFIN